VRRIGLAFCLFIGVLALIGFTSPKANAAVKPQVAPHTAPVIGNTACGSLDGTPYAQVTGGKRFHIKVDWLGSSSNANCSTYSTSCPDFFGSCSAGFWVAGLWCSTLAASDLAAGQSDCDLNNIIVLTDYNAGGTSYNQCTTLSTIGSIFGGLPGTLNCLADGSGSNGWTEKWANGSASGAAWGPIPETGSSTPFNPGASGVDCPPSAANIAAGAFKNYCAFVILPINFTYYCVADICLPDTGDANDGVSEDTSDYLAELVKYKKVTTSGVARFLK
jgi:hypothetical protein